MNGSIRPLFGCLTPLPLFLMLVCLAVPVGRVAAQTTPKPPGAPGAPAPRPAAKSPGDAAEGKAPPKPDPEAELRDLFKKEESITNTLGMVMVWVPAGYRVGQLEVTQEQFEKISGDNPSHAVGSRNPVERVTWTEAASFCTKLTEKEIAAGKLPKGYSYSLPSESQWEFYVADADLKDAITSRLGDRRGPEPVGTLSSNKLGLYDVRGNVWEWCSSPIARGGSWRTFEDWLRTSFRFTGDASTRYDDIGFRVVLSGAP